MGTAMKEIKRCPSLAWPISFCSSLVVLYLLPFHLLSLLGFFMARDSLSLTGQITPKWEQSTSVLPSEQGLSSYGNWSPLWYQLCQITLQDQCPPGMPDPSPFVPLSYRIYQFLLAPLRQTGDVTKPLNLFFLTWPHSVPFTALMTDEDWDKYLGT